MTLRKNHHFKTDIDNPPIGLLICKDKDNVVAKYALEAYKEPMGISALQTLPERLQIIYADYRGIGKGVER